MERLSAPVPPMLSDAIGYTHDAEWIAVYWGTGEEMYWEDGRISAGGNGHAYLTFTHHAAVARHLEGLDLGGGYTPATHRLLLHRRTNHLYAATLGEARRVLAEQWEDYEQGGADLAINSWV